MHNYARWNYFRMIQHEIYTTQIKTVTIEQKNQTTKLIQTFLAFCVRQKKSWLTKLNVLSQLRSRANANVQQSYHNRKPILPFVLTWQRYYSTKQVLTSKTGPLQPFVTPFYPPPVLLLLFSHYPRLCYFPLIPFPLAIWLQVSISIFYHSFSNSFSLAIVVDFRFLFFFPRTFFWSIFVTKFANSTFFNTLSNKEAINDNLNTVCNPGVGNFFGLAGHIRDKLGIPGPAHVYFNGFLGCLYVKVDIFWLFNVFSLS